MLIWSLLLVVHAHIAPSVLHHRGRLVPILVQMQAPTRLIAKVRASTFPSSDARAAALVDRLRGFAAHTQKDLAVLLARLQADQEVTAFRSYYISNTVAVEATHAAIAAIASLASVRMIGPNFVILQPIARRDFFYPEFAQDADPSPGQAPSAYGRGLKRIGIHQVSPAVVQRASKLVYGIMDSGADYRHPFLADNYVGNNGPNHTYAWFDASRDTSPAYPQDAFGHGTKVLALAVGKHPIGVSPESRWLACLSNKHNDNPTEFYLACQQFLLAPTDLQGTNPDARRRPHVVGSSWGCAREENCFAVPFQHADNALHAAGIFSVAASGNFGDKGCGSTDHPPTVNQHSFVVTALEHASDERIPFSSLGPSPRRTHAIDVAVPAQFTLTCTDAREFEYSSGTSIASAIVAGSALLVMAACPHLERDPDALAEVLRRSATPLFSHLGCSGDTPTTRPNNEFGYGMANITAAIQQCRSQ